MESAPEREDRKEPPPVKPQIEVTIVGEKLTQSLCRILANDRAVAVLNALLRGAKTASEIGAITGSSIQLVSYHLRAMLLTGLVGVERVIKGRRGRDVKVYIPTKSLFVLVLKPIVEESRVDLRRLREALTKAMAMSVALFLVMMCPLWVADYRVNSGLQTFQSTAAYSQAGTLDQYGGTNVSASVFNQEYILIVSITCFVAIVFCLGREMSTHFGRPDITAVGWRLRSRNVCYQ